MNQIDVGTLEAWKLEGKVYRLIDVREDFERELKHIGGEHMPLAEIKQLYTPLDVSETVVVYCRKGIRSLIAIQRLQELYPTVHFMNLKGGIG